MSLAETRRRRTHIVGIGGGTGLSVLLSGLKSQAQKCGGRSPLEISAIVSVADDGGSTGRLRRELDIPALGDLRACLIAASRGDSLWQQLFQHRFTGGCELEGHALGNLMVAALLERSGGLSSALAQLAGPLRLCARVLPVSEDRVTLCAELDDGAIVCGESAIPARGGRIRRVWLSPEATPAPDVLETLAAADAIVLGPGSLYTSVIANLLVDGVAEAIRNSPALRVFVCNLWTQPGETDGLDAAGHVRAIERYLGAGALDVCLVNTASSRGAGACAGGLAGAESLRREAVVLASRVEALGALPIVADLADAGPNSHRHDPEKLAALVVSMARGMRRGAPAPAPSPWITPPSLSMAAAQTVPGVE